MYRYRYLSSYKRQKKRNMATRKRMYRCTILIHSYMIFWISAEGINVYRCSILKSTSRHLVFYFHLCLASSIRPRARGGSCFIVQYCTVLRALLFRQQYQFIIIIFFFSDSSSASAPFTLPSLLPPSSRHLILLRRERRNRRTPEFGLRRAAERYSRKNRDHLRTDPRRVWFFE